jgi:hypothetical protein
MANKTKSIHGTPLFSNGKTQQKSIILGIPRIDTFWGGFSPATTTLIDGHHGFLNQLLTIVSVQAIDAFNQNILYIDGGNSIDPYQIISVAKRKNLGLHQVMTHILVARAFNTYQLDTLIRTLEKKIKDHYPSVLIVPYITSLLVDKNIKKKEGETLLKWWLNEITRVTTKYNLISLISSDIPYMNWYTHSLWKILNTGVDTIVRLTPKKKSIMIRFIKQERTLEYLPIPFNQSTLDEFTGGKKDG